MKAHFSCSYCWQSAVSGKEGRGGGGGAGGKDERSCSQKLEESGRGSFVGNPAS